MDFSQYIRPELLILIPVLNLIGMFFKKARLLNCKYIPLILGGAGIALGAAYAMLFPKSGCDMLQSALMGALQGILCAGMAVYGHQMSRQMKRSKEAAVQTSDSPKAPAEAAANKTEEKDSEA